MAISAENIRDDVIGNLGNRDDLTPARVYRVINYSQLAIARLTRWRDMITTTSFTHTGWAGVSITADATILVTAIGIAIPSRIRSVISFYLADFPEARQERLHRVPTFEQWDGMRDRIVGTSSRRATPTHYFFPSRNSVEFFPVPDRVYDFQLRTILYPPEVTEALKANSLTITNCDDLVMARSTYI